MISKQILVQEQLDDLNLVEELETHGYNQDTIETIIEAEKQENLVGPFSTVADLMKDLHA